MSLLANLMLNTLEYMTEADFNRFKHLLKDEGSIPWGKLEKAEAYDAVEEMIKVYSLKAGAVMLRLLKKMNHNHLATDLERELERKGCTDLIELMRNTLDYMTGADFKRFKHLLKDESSIPWGKLEKADTDDAVEEMVKVKSLEAGAVMLRLLKKMNQNHLAWSLERELERKGLQKSECGSGSSSSTTPGASGVTVTATAHSGGSVNCPAISGATFHGPVNFGGASSN